MTKSYNIVFHARDQKAQLQSHSITVNVEENKIDGIDDSLPNEERPSAYDAVKFNEILNWLSQQFYLSNKDNPLDSELHILDLHLKVLQYLRYSYSYRGYQFFNAEYAEVVRLRLIAENKHIQGYEPEMSLVLKAMQKDGFFLGADALKLEQIGKEIIRQWQVIKDLQGKQSGTSYPPTQINSLPYKPYFEKLGVTSEHNTKTPEDYLKTNFDVSKDKDSLLHVRQCEDIGCSMNAKKSPLVKLIPNNMRAQIIESVTEQHPNVFEPFLYCGFASGLLLRDLEIISELIFTAKRKNMELFFVDKSYETFINMVTDDCTPNLQEHVDTTFLYKAVRELAEWVANHLNTDESNPLKIHLFSDAADAQEYLKHQGKKLSLLVGQDFFTDTGCHSHRYSTPGAHDAFMSLAKSSLGERGRYFELIKDDLKDEVYSRKGTIKDNGEVPLVSKLWRIEQRESKIYKEVPFTFFAASDRDSQNLLIKRQYDESAQLRDVKRYE